MMPTMPSRSMGSASSISSYVLETYQSHPAIDEIRVVCLKGWEDILASYLERYGITKCTGITLGGDSGVRSVERGITDLDGACRENDIIIILNALLKQ